MLDKYVGQMIDLVYMDRTGRITQREIRINSIKSGKIRASSGEEGSPRPFFWSKAYWHGVPFPVRTRRKEYAKQF